MRYLSVCSGIEAASVAWHPLGWTAVAFSEIEAYPRALLKERWPDVPLHGDFTTIGGTEYGPTDLLVGGTPCQSFSVAGLRRGMADERGNLALEFLRLAQRTGARWVVWENVPGVLSSNDGRDFGSLLGGLAELGYGWAYRVLDAQYIRVDGYARAVAQRRRRVFLVGNLGNVGRPTNASEVQNVRRAAFLSAAVLFERESLSGHPAPSRNTGQAAPTIPSRSSAGGGLGTDFDCDGGLIPNVSPALKAQDYKGPSSDGDGDGAPLLAVAHTLTKRYDSSPQGGWGGTPVVPIDLRQASRGEKMTNNRREGSSGGPPGTGVGDDGDPAFSVTERGQAIAFSCKDHGQDAGDVSPTLRSMNERHSTPNGGGQVAIAIQERAVSENPENGPQGAGFRDDGAAYTLESRHHVQAVALAMAVRRLTPRECERLQGFEDDYTLVTYNKKPAKDGPRYKALGNSMAVNCMRWLGRRIAQVEAL